MNLDVNYSFILAKVRINLDFLVKKLESPNFVILMSLKIFKGELKPQGAKDLMIVFWIHSIKFWRFSLLQICVYMLVFIIEFLVIVNI